jgi:hypothetical protein
MSLESKPKDADEVGHEVEAEHRGEMCVVFSLRPVTAFSLKFSDLHRISQYSFRLFYECRLSMMKQMKVRP